jgi:hypothetical protein
MGLTPYVPSFENPLSRELVRSMQENVTLFG